MRTSFTIPGGLMLGLLDCVTGDTVAITADRATVAAAAAGAGRSDLPRRHVEPAGV